MVATPDLAVAAARARARAEQRVRPPLTLPSTAAPDPPDPDVILAQAFGADAARSATSRPPPRPAPASDPDPAAADGGVDIDSQDKAAILAPASASPSSDDTDDATHAPRALAPASSGPQPSELPPSGSTLGPPSSQQSCDSASLQALPRVSSFAQTSSFQYQLEHFDSRSIFTRTWTQEQAADADLDTGAASAPADVNRFIHGANLQSQALLAQPPPVYPRFDLPPLPAAPPHAPGLRRSPSPSTGFEQRQLQDSNQPQSQPLSQAQTQTVEPGLVLPPLPILPPLPPLPPPLPVSQGTSNGGESQGNSHNSFSPANTEGEGATSHSASQSHSQEHQRSHGASRSPSAAAATTPTIVSHPVPADEVIGSADGIDALSPGIRAGAQEKIVSLTPDQISAARFKAYSNGVSSAKGNGGGNGTLGGTRMPRLTVALHNAYMQAAKMLPDSLVFTGMMRRDTKAAEQALRAQDTTRIAADGKPIKTRRRTLPHEASVLLAFFNENQFPASFERDELSAITGMRPRAVTIWFQNRRQTEKKRQGGEGSADEDTNASGARGHRTASHESEERPRSSSSSKSGRRSAGRMSISTPSLPPGHQFPPFTGPPPAPAFYLPPHMPLAVQQNSVRALKQDEDGDEEEDEDDEEEGDLALDPLAPASTSWPAQSTPRNSSGQWHPAPPPQWGGHPMVYSGSNVGVLSSGSRPTASLNRGVLPLSARLSGSTSAPSLHHDAPSTALPRTMGLGLAPARRASAKPSQSLRSTVDAASVTRRGGKEPSIGALVAANVDALVSNAPRSAPAGSSNRGRNSSSPPEDDEGDSQARLLARMHSSSSVTDSSISCPSSPEKRSSSASGPSGDETIRKRPRMSSARKTVPGTAGKTIVSPGSTAPLERIRPVHRGTLEALATVSSLASSDRSEPPPASSSEEMSAVEGLLWISQRQPT